MFTRLYLLMASLMLSVPALAAGNQYVLSVKGVACPYCAYGIEKRLNKIDGINELQVDIGDSVVRVTMQENQKLTEVQARRAVKEAGFTLQSFSQVANGEDDDDAP